LGDSPNVESSLQVTVRRVGDAGQARGGSAETDVVAVEEPLEIRLSEQSISITMRTPGDDLNLAAGFLFTEGMIENAAQIASFAYLVDADSGDTNPNIVVAELAPGVSVDTAKLQRHFYTTSSCGVCGKSSLEALSTQASYPVVGDELRVSADVLSALPDALLSRQRTFSDTGGLHAAGLFRPDGTLLDVREDVGRHNAVDKLVGHALTNDDLPLANLGVLVSGRTSFEIMQKLRMAGCPLVAAVGAPSSLAVELAWEFDMTLVGFLRDGRFNVYSGPGRIA
jgi:FdhD protein